MESNWLYKQAVIRAFVGLCGIDQNGDGAVSLPGNRFHDYVLQTDYLLGKEGSMIGGFIYLGKTPYPASSFTNSFQRAGLVGTWKPKNLA